MTGKLGIVLASLIAWSSPVLADERPPVPPWRSAVAAEHWMAGLIWLPRAHHAVTPATLAAMLAGADVVLLGETHDNPDHHALQAWVLRRLIASGRRPALAFEMLGADQAPALSAHLARDAGDAGGIGAAVDFAGGGWGDWAAYAPLARIALDAGLPLVAANPPREQVRLIVRFGMVPQELAARLGGGPRLPEPMLAALRREIQDSHCGMLTEPAVARMALAQIVKDANMAAVLADTARVRPGGVVLLLGSGHARLDRGVPYHLRALAPQAKVFSLGLIEIDRRAGSADLAALAAAYDAVWFTPAVAEDDGCGAFSAHPHPPPGS